MSITAFAIENKITTYFVMALLCIAGIASFLQLGQLEDPEFSIKDAMVITSYPGASPKEVELEVTDLIEKSIQEMPQIDYIESISKANVSLVKVSIKDSYWSDKLPQIWDLLRRKVNDVQMQLPPGAGPSIVNDSFGDVYGHLIAITGDGFSYSELENYADEVIRKELYTLEGVARIDLWGTQSKAIYVDVSETQLSQLGVTESDVIATLQQQNLVVDAGHVDIQDRRLRISPTGEFQSPEDIADLVVRPGPVSSLSQATNQVSRTDDATELIRIRHIGTVRRGYQDPPSTMMRYNGKESIAIAISNTSGAHIVSMGELIDAKLKELESSLPVGLELNKVHWQSEIVDESINGFFINLIEAVVIVLVVLAVAMGWRMGVIIGSALIMTILVTFIIMSMMDIALQRMSLGALVIALGMMVDNSIVVADGIAVRLQKGMKRKEAAIEAATLPSIPLLGATVIAVMAFYPIFASTADAGEYCRTLFTVVAISLLSSWLISLTLTPLQCMDMLPENPDSDSEDSSDPKGFMGVFKKFLIGAIRRRWLTIGALSGLLVASIFSFSFVTQLFFPDSTMKKAMIDFWATQGTNIETVSQDLKALENKLMEDDRIDAVSTFIGAGPPRFYLPVEPEKPNNAYAQIIISVNDYEEIDGIIRDMTPWLKTQYPDALVPIRKYGVGPSDTWKFELRVSGTARTESSTLREIASRGFEILENESLVGAYQTDWRQRTQVIEPEYNQERARWAAITRNDVANATKRAYDGRVIGIYRERDDIIPIIMRNQESERKNVSAIDVLQLRSSLSTESLPMSQVIDGVEPEWEDPILVRRDRRPTITIQANPVPGTTLPTLMKKVGEPFDQLEVPTGFLKEWGAERESSADAQKSLLPGVIPAVLIIAVILVALFNQFKPALVIACTIPFVAIGIVFGLLIFNAPFGFVALLGAMSLTGMMIKNSVVLLDEIKLNLKNDMAPYDAVIEAGLSRLRPVALAAGTTVLGVVPLLQDPFWIGMAVTIMAGLTFAVILTMILVPVLYTAMNGITREDAEKHA